MKELAARISGAGWMYWRCCGRRRDPCPSRMYGGRWSSPTAGMAPQSRRSCAACVKRRRWRRRSGRCFITGPCSPVGEYQIWSTRSLIDKGVPGQRRSLVAALVERSQLSREDLAELRAVLYPEGGTGPWLTVCSACSPCLSPGRSSPGDGAAGQLLRGRISRTAGLLSLAAGAAAAAVSLGGSPTP